MTYGLAKLTRFRLQSGDGRPGKVSDFLLRDDRWTVRYLVGTIGSWAKRREVLVCPEECAGVDENRRLIQLRPDSAALATHPSIEEDKPVCRQNIIPWMIIYEPLNGFTVTEDSKRRMEAELARGKGDPRLRSVREILRYSVQGLDGEIGRFKDVLVDKSLGVVRYLAVVITGLRRLQTRLIAPDMIAAVSWPSAEIHINTTRAALLKSQLGQGEIL
jgi:hypothetical protein